MAFSCALECPERLGAIWAQREHGLPNAVLTGGLFGIRIEYVECLCMSLYVLVFLLLFSLLFTLS